MSINSIYGSSQTDPLLSSYQTQQQQQQQYWAQLAQALQSGNVTSAQQAFAALQQNAPQTAQASPTAQTGQASQLTTDMKSLGAALQSGDTSAAKTAFAKVQQDMQTARKGHHHHHGAPQLIDGTDPSPITTTAASEGTGLSLTA